MHCLAVDSRLPGQSSHRGRIGKMSLGLSEIGLTHLFFNLTVFTGPGNTHFEKLKKCAERASFYPAF